MQKPTPIPLAMVICDTVIEDKKTGKKSLIGLFDSINARKAPCTHNSMSVFVALTQGIGEYSSKIRCIKSDDNKVLLEGKGKIVFKDRKHRIDFIFALNGLKFPEFGEYRFELLCDDKLIIGRHFNVRRMQDK